MAVDAGLIAWIEEALESIGVVTKRAMMGGATLYLDGTVFAIVADDALWIKADTASDVTWDEAGCVRFTYTMSEREGSMNYRGAPDDVYDDADALSRWPLLGVEAGARAPARKAKARPTR